jgi:hypothetical protein
VGVRRAWAGFGCWAKNEGEAHLPKENDFSFPFSNKQSQYSFLSKKNSFLGHGPKIKVVQNFNLFNIALGYILKFQLDFEIGI